MQKLYTIILICCAILVVSEEAFADRVAIYRLYNGKDHFYTTDCDELNAAQKMDKYKLEGTYGYLERNQVEGSVPVFRLYGGSLHFYTADKSERDRVVSGGFYKDEGIIGYISSNSGEGKTPFFRSYDSKSGDHFYTTDPSEVDKAVESGYQKEGTVGYVWMSGAQCR